ncbi:HTH-type transcriptional regulator MurR [Clostridium puniceum]|uniref:HTH-type transcriptional regulator MurR n=1 Tax=Clostridium puniceum TaxID=29367 RepID=A0A1S8TCV7_9CLOT|nr:MurR/RpiR family transcriptional regulator [Clostridium puniceum]OOM75434.1 HTH-type transcriptional regulator MurR [Clostridium puniceum]
MVIEKLRRGINFTENEKIISEFILNHPNEFQKMSSEELGKTTFTSKSTVIRLCKKLNVLGYQELKKVLYSELNEERLLGKEDVYPILSKKSTYIEIDILLQQVYKKAIDEVNLSNNQNIINRIINQMINMEKIEFYSTGMGYATLETVSHKFNSIGIESTVSSTLNERYLVSAKKKFKIMAFVLSISGNNPFIIRTAEVLRHLGIYLVGVVGPLSDDISKYCDELIHIPISDFVEGMEIVSNQHSINYIFDMIFTQMLANKYEEIVAWQKEISYDYHKDIFKMTPKCQK